MVDKPSSIVRPATPRDAGACQEIYRYYVDNTAITFENDVPAIDEMAERIESALATHQWLILEHGGTVLGYAYAHPLGTRAAYQWSVETSIYIAADQHRSGGGRALYTELLRRLGERGYRRALACITQPNPASNAFHESFGFEHVGLFRCVGWKLGSWHHVAWMQRDLPCETASNDPPTAPR